MRDQNRDQGLFDARGRVEEDRLIDDSNFQSRDEVLKAFAGLPPMDYKRFRGDIDAYVDPTPREWFC